MSRDELIIKQTIFLTFNEDNFQFLSVQPGAFILYNRKKDIIYVGFAKMFQIRDKLNKILNGSEMLDIKFFKFLETISNTNAVTLFEKLKDYFKPKHNR